MPKESEVKGLGLFYRRCPVGLGLRSLCGSSLSPLILSSSDFLIVTLCWLLMIGPDEHCQVTGLIFGEQWVEWIRSRCHPSGLSCKTVRIPLFLVDP